MVSNGQLTYITIRVTSNKTTTTTIVSTTMITTIPDALITTTTYSLSVKFDDLCH